MAISNKMGSALGTGISQGLSTFMAQLPSILQQYNKEARTKKGKSILDQFEAENPILQTQAGTATPQITPGVSDVSLGEGGGLVNRPQPQERQDTALSELSTPTGPTQAAPVKRSKAMENASRFQSTIDDLSKKHGLDSAEVKVVMGVESGGGVSNLSPTGVRGPMMVTGKTANEYGYKGSDMTDSTKSIDAGVQHLAAIKKRHPSWTPEQRWAAYNMGEGAVEKAIKEKGMGWEGNLVMNATEAKKKELNSGLKRYRSYSNELSFGSGISTGDAAEQQAETTTRKESTLTNVESVKSASDTLDALLSDLKTTRPKKGEGRSAKKLEYFYENASPDIVKAMEPMIKKLENMSASEAKAYEQKLNVWNNESDRKVRVAIAKAQLEANSSYKQEVLDMKIKKSKRETDIKKLKLLSKNLLKKQTEWNDIIDTAKKKGDKTAFKKQHPDVFLEKDVPRTILWDTKEWVVNTTALTKLQKEINDVNEKLQRLEALPIGGEDVLPTTGGAGGKRDYSHLFTPVE